MYPVEAIDGGWNTIEGGEVIEWNTTTSESTASHNFTLTPPAQDEVFYSYEVTVEDDRFTPLTGGFPFPVPYDGDDTVTDYAPLVP